MLSLWMAALSGGAAGIVAGVFGKSVLIGAFSGAFAGILVGALFNLLPRGPMDSRTGNGSPPFAGFVGGIVSTVTVQAGYVGAFASCGVGFVVGLLIPAVLVFFVMSGRSGR